MDARLALRNAIRVRNIANDWRRLCGISEPAWHLVR